LRAPARASKVKSRTPILPQKAKSRDKGVAGNFKTAPEIGASRVCETPRFAKSGFAALLCGRAAPFRAGRQNLSILLAGALDGKAEPFRPARRRNRNSQ